MVPVEMAEDDRPVEGVGSSSSAVTLRMPVPASSTRLGRSPSWARATHEVCPP